MSPLSHALSQVHRKGILVETKRYWTLHDPVKLLSGNDGLDCVTNFDEAVKMRSYEGVDGALGRSSGFLCVTCETEEVWFARSNHKRQHGWTCPEHHEN